MTVHMAVRLFTAIGFAGISAALELPTQCDSKDFVKSAQGLLGHLCARC